MPEATDTEELRRRCAETSLERAVALHPDFYANPFWLDFEQREIFARSWQIAGPESAVAEPGDHVVAEIAGRPILIVRGGDGVLRAFYNICAHRAGPLALCDGKGAKRLRCAYHGWTYELDGRLRAAPEMQGAADFDASAVRLRQIALKIWQGFLFVALEDDAPPFDDVYGGIAGRIAPIDLSAMRFARRDIHRVDANWKVYVDNFLEGYHVPVVHPALNAMVDYAGYATELGEWSVLQTSTLSGAADVYGDGAVYYYFIYPNIMLNIVPGRAQTNRVIPDGPGRCLVEFDYYYADEAAQARGEADRAFSNGVQDEDRMICERVQKALVSGAYAPGRLCPKREQGVWRWHNLLRRAYGAALEG